MLQERGPKGAPDMAEQALLPLLVILPVDISRCHDAGNHMDAALQGRAATAQGYAAYPGQPRLQARRPRVLAIAPVQAVGAQPRAAVHEVEGCKHQRTNCAHAPTGTYFCGHLSASSS